MDAFPPADTPPVMNAPPPPVRSDTPPRRHWSRHLIRLVAFAAIVAVVAYLYSRGAR
jgi:hypothetical protein